MSRLDASEAAQAARRVHTRRRKRLFAWAGLLAALLFAIPAWAAPPSRGKKNVRTKRGDPPVTAPADEHGDAPGDGDGAHDGGAAAGGHGEQGGGHGAEHGGHPQGVKWLGAATPEDPRTGVVILIINFIVLMFVLERILFSNLRKQHGEKREAIKRDLERAATARKEAEALLAEIEGRMKRIDDTLGEILDEAEQRAKTESERILARAHADADRIVAAAKAAGEREAAAARAAIEREIVDQAITAAQALLRGQLSDADQQRMVTAYVGELASVDMRRAS